MVEKKKKKKLTLKEQAFVKELVKTNNQTEAASRVYDVSNRDVAKNLGSQVMSREHVRLALQEAFDRQGITLQNVTAEQHKLLKQDENLTVKQRAVENVYNLMDAYPAKQTEHKSVKLNIDARIEGTRVEQALDNLLDSSNDKS